MPAPIRSVAERVQPHGFPYTLDEPSQFWSVLLGTLTGGQVAVVVFTNEDGVFLGYHDAKDAKELAPMIRRKRGVCGVAIVPASGRLRRY